MSAVLILTTAGSRAEADRIAATLVGERLAACVQVDAVGSVYRWQGAVETTEEYRLQIKTRASRAAEVEARIKALHSYELPEILILDARGSADYVKWLGSETSP